MTTYKLQAGYIINRVKYDLFMDDIYIGTNSYIAQQKAIYPKIGESDTYQEADKYGNIYHELTGKQFKNMIRSNEFGVYTDILLMEQLAKE